MSKLEKFIAAHHSDYTVINANCVMLHSAFTYNGKTGSEEIKLLDSGKVQASSVIAGKRYVETYSSISAYLGY